MSEYEENEEVMDIWRRLGIKVTNPLKFVADLSRAQQLEIQMQQDPQASVPLIQVYERLLGQAETEKNPALYASICNNLGTLYRDLPTGDRAANLQEAVRCYREALRFWTAENVPAQYSVVQSNLAIAYRS